MSTRSTISVKINEKFHAIYCHFDGYNYDGGVGPTLRKYHSSYDHAKKLIELGSLSYVDKGEAKAYHRDRGDPWSRCRPKVLADKESLVLAAKNWDADYMYVFDEGVWTVTKL